MQRPDAPAATYLRLAIEEHEPGTYWGPDGAQVSRDELLALLDVERTARVYEGMASFDFYPDERVQARVELRNALDAAAAVLGG